MTSPAFTWDPTVTPLPTGLDNPEQRPVVQPGENGSGLPPQSASPIESLYNQYLGRQSDQSGLNFWNNALNSGTSLSDIENSFKNSSEGQINSLYQQDFGRNADASGSQFWQNALNSGQSLNDINQAFMASDEYQKLQTQPPPSQPTIDPISPSFAPISPSFAPISPSFAPISPSFAPNIRDDSGRVIGQRDPGPIQSPLDTLNTDQLNPFTSTKDLIGQYYQADLGRTADQPGLEFWSNAVDSGQLSMDQALQAIRDSQEGQVINPQARAMTLSEYQKQNPATYVGGNPYLDYLKQFNQPQVDPKPEVSRSQDWEPPGPDIFDESGNVIGHRTEEERMTPPKWYTDQFADTGLKGLGQFYQGIIPQDATDPVMDFVKNLDQQPLYLQNAFQQQLQRFGDPVQAARAVIGSLT